MKKFLPVTSRMSRTCGRRTCSSQTEYDSLELLLESENFRNTIPARSSSSVSRRIMKYNKLLVEVNRMRSEVADTIDRTFSKTCSCGRAFGDEATYREHR